MAAKTVKLRAWTKEDVLTLKTLGRARTTAAVVARRLKRSYAATRKKASILGVSVGSPRKKKRTG